MGRLSRALLLGASILASADALACEGRTVCVSWEAVTKNTDGSAAATPMKYRVWRVTGATKVFLVETAALNATLQNEPLGDQCWAATAVDSLGRESALSNKACKTVRNPGPTNGAFEGPKDGSFEPNKQEN